MATYVFRRTGSGAVQRARRSANGTLSGTRTFRTGQAGFARNNRLASRPGSSMGINVADDKS